MVIQLHRNTDHQVVGYQVVFIGTWDQAVNDCHRRQDADRVVNFQVRSTRDPRWQHLVAVASTRNTDQTGRRRGRWETAAKVNRVVKAAGLVDQRSAGGWFYRDGKPIVQGSEHLFSHFKAAALIVGDSYTYGVAGYTTPQPA